METKDPWGNQENAVMLMQKQWRKAVDESAKYYHVNQLLEAQILELKQQLAKVSEG